MDTIHISDLHVETIIGVYSFEREKPQPLIIDLELGTDFSKAFISDDLNDALDYDAIHQQVRLFCVTSQYALLEGLAGGIIRLLFNTPSINRVAIHIRKPQALEGAMAAVKCERIREEM